MSLAYLDDSNTLIVSKPLAKALGINGSIALRRVQMWLKYNEDHKKDKAETHFYQARWWTRNGYTGWVNDLEIMSYATVRRTFTGLEQMRLLKSTGALNRHPKDATKWWTIDYGRYVDFMDLWAAMGSPLYRDGNRQSKDYAAFLKEWYLRLAFSIFWFPIAQTLLTVNRVDPTPDPAHGEQGTLLTVDRGTLLTVDSPPAHGEQPYPRESTNDSFSDESTEQNKPQGRGGGDEPIHPPDEEILGTDSKPLTESGKLLRAQALPDSVAHEYGWIDAAEVLKLIEQTRDKLKRGEIRVDKVAYLIGSLKKIEAREREDYTRSVAHGLFAGTFEAFIADKAAATQAADRLLITKASGNGQLPDPTDDVFLSPVEFEEIAW